MIDWKRNRKTLERLPDPTRMFSILCLTIMTFRYHYADNNQQSIGNTLHGFYLNPYVLLFLSSALLAVYAARRHNKDREQQDSSAKLPVHDRWAAEWYFWNAWLYHATMDGASGSLRLVPLVVHTYDMLDGRFILGDVVPWLVGLIELFCMYPLCLACMYCILTRKYHLRFPLELITSTMHIMGMVLFVGDELYRGQIHVPALDPVGKANGGSDDEDGEYSAIWENLKFWNLYHITFYWFGFWFCNLVWAWVPLIRIRRALMECQRAFEVANVEKKNK